MYQKVLYTFVFIGVIAATARAQSVVATLSPELLSSYGHDLAVKATLNRGAVFYLSRDTASAGVPALTVAHSSWATSSSMPIRTLDLHGQAASFVAHTCQELESRGIGQGVTHLMTGTTRFQRLGDALEQVEWDGHVQSVHLWTETADEDSAMIVQVSWPPNAEGQALGSIVFATSTSTHVITLHVFPGESWDVSFQDLVEIMGQLHAPPTRAYAGPRADVIDASQTSATSASAGCIGVVFKGNYAALRDAAFEAPDRLGASAGIIRAARCRAYTDGSRTDVVDPINPNRQKGFASWIALYGKGRPFVDPIIFLVLE